MIHADDADADADADVVEGNLIVIIYQASDINEVRAVFLWRSASMKSTQWITFKKLPLSEGFNFISIYLTMLKHNFLQVFFKNKFLLFSFFCFTIQ